jgi:hypothetical protein
VHNSFSNVMVIESNLPIGQRPTKNSVGK